MRAAKPLFAHLLAMTDTTGLFEHARYSRPRPEHGYCVDDVARGLVVLSRAAASGTAATAEGVRGATTSLAVPEPTAPDELARLAWLYLRFVARAQDAAGRVINRCDVAGSRRGEYSVQDCWGRALWGLGTAAARSSDAELAQRAMGRFEISARQRSRWPRAMAFAGLGAAEVLRVDPAHAAARSLLADAATTVGRPASDRAWPWPQPRLTYANAVIPDVLIAAGNALDDGRLLHDGLRLLGWLLQVETSAGHVSVTAAGGWALGEPRPAFDQQPIEVAALADACARAFELTGEQRWAQAVDGSADWFFGGNDLGIPLYDDVTGGCCDGLEVGGRNENQGAESTLSLISTVQHASRLAPAAR